MLIGLYGNSRAGKDTVARVLQEHEYEWRSFAEPLRQILLNINPCVDCDFQISLQESVKNFGWNGTKKNYPESVDMMIALGQSVRDLLHEDAWIWGVLTDPMPKNMVISDVRQPNEYEAIIDAGGEVWQIIRPGTTKRKMDGLLDHNYFTTLIYNNGSIDDLENMIAKELEYAKQNRWT